MEKIEFKPNVFTPWRIFYSSFMIILALLVFLLIYFHFFSGINDTWRLILNLVLGVPILAFGVAIVVMLIQLGNKKIIVNGESIEFWQKSLFGDWKQKTINLDSLVLVGSREKLSIIPAGEGVLSLTLYWLVFNYENERKEEFSLSYAWDKDMVKNALIFLKKIHPNIKFDTYVYQDSSEELVGM